MKPQTPLTSGAPQHTDHLGPHQLMNAMDVKDLPTASNASLQKREWIGVVGILCLHASMLGWGAYRHSPTIDEPAYLSAGVSHWTFGRFDLAKVSPPLVRLVAAIPVCLVPHASDWTSYHIGPGIRAEHETGRDFLVANGRRSFWLFTIARWACLPFSLIGACVCFRWARQLWGHRSGFAALLLWCFCPNILAHGAMLTPDVGVTALSLAAAYLYWQWTKSRTWPDSIAAGVVLGLAVLAKTNAVVLVPLLPLLASAAVLMTARQYWTRSIVKVAASIFVAIYTINMGYGFEGGLQRLDSYEFTSQSFRGAGAGLLGNRFKATPIGWIPVPLPKSFLEGIDLQRRDFENSTGKTQTYFQGVWYNHSWWWYYLYAVGVKVPLGALALLILSVGLLIFHAKIRQKWIDLLFVVLPGFALFAIASSQTGFGHSLRYVLPAFGFVFVFVSGSLGDGLRSRFTTLAASIALIAHVASSLAVYPHSLSYFNELAGGPMNGHAHLLDGNLDWSQDLLYLEDWIKSHPEARPLHVGFWGFLPLQELQAKYSDFDFSASGPLPDGWYAISVNHLRRDFRMGDPKYAVFLKRTPVATAGYSIYIYRIPHDEQRSP